MEYLKTLCKDLNLNPTLEKTSRGASILPLNESLDLEILNLNPGVYFFSPICDLSKKKMENLLILLCKANLFGQGTRGSVIGLDEKMGLTLSLALPYDMDYQSFKESLEDFANVVDYWREEVNRFQTQAQDGIL